MYTKDDYMRDIYIKDHGVKGTERSNATLRAILYEHGKIENIEKSFPEYAGNCDVDMENTGEYTQKDYFNDLYLKEHAENGNERDNAKLRAYLWEKGQVDKMYHMPGNTYIDPRLKNYLNKASVPIVIEELYQGYSFTPEHIAKKWIHDELCEKIHDGCEQLQKVIYTRDSISPNNVSAENYTAVYLDYSKAIENIIQEIKGYMDEYEQIYSKEIDDLKSRYENAHSVNLKSFVIPVIALVVGIFCYKMGYILPLYEDATAFWCEMGWPAIISIMITGIGRRFGCPLLPSEDFTPSFLIDGGIAFILSIIGMNMSKVSYGGFGIFLTAIVVGAISGFICMITRFISLMIAGKWEYVNWMPPK